MFASQKTRALAGLWVTTLSSMTDEKKSSADQIKVLTDVKCKFSNGCRATTVEATFSYHTFQNLTPNETYFVVLFNSLKPNSFAVASDVCTVSNVPANQQQPQQTERNFRGGASTYSKFLPSPALHRCGKSQF